MALREEFERTGGWLFSHRGYLPLVMLAPICVALLRYHYPEGRHDLDQLWEMLCLSIGLAGLFVRAMTVGFTPAGTSGRNTAEQVAASLNVRGMYSLVRHPLYVGNYLMWLGPSLFPRVWWVPVLVTLAFWLYYERIMFAEEEFLRRSFGTEYEEWAARTPAFIPTHFRWVTPKLPFSLRNVLRREYSGFFGLIATFVVLEIVSDFAATGGFEWDRLWGAIFAASLVVYVVLRTLKRQTRILHVEGR
jgi:protein-S-isoprenylcysteine O-methyltransferase Ste14